MNSNFALFAQKAYSCLLAKKALAFKSISFSRLSRSFSLFSLRRSSAIWNGLASGPPGRVDLLDPVGQAARVAAQPARHLGVRRARFPARLHGLLLEFRRIPGRWIAHGPPRFPPLRPSCRNGNRIVNGSGADSDSDSRGLWRRSPAGPGNRIGKALQPVRMGSKTDPGGPAEPCPELSRTPRPAAARARSARENAGRAPARPSG